MEWAALLQCKGNTIKEFSKFQYVEHIKML